MKACKESRLLGLCLLLVVFAVPSAQGEWISSVVRTGSSTQPLPVIAPLTEGSVCYNDRGYVYASVPTGIFGAQYVQVSNNDKFTDPYTLTVTMSADATLYLFLDNCLGDAGCGQGKDPTPLPPQMSWVNTLGFTNAGFDIGIDENADGFSDNYFSVFSKHVNADDVIALGVQNAGNWNMYAVAAIPSAEAQCIASAVRTTNNSQPAPEIAPAPLTERSGGPPWTGSVCYNNKPHIYASVPTEILGAQYVQVCNADKTTGDYTLTVTMSANATLYLFLDNRLGGGQGVPPQMSWVTTLGFTDTGLDMGIDESADGSINNYFSLFSKQVMAADVITLGVQCDGSARNMYAVAAMPIAASNPSPTNGATDVATDAVLSWTPAIGASSHHIYFGTNQDDVATGTGGTDKGAPPETSYTPGALAYGTTYYWRVDEFDGTTYPGNIWSFTTQGQGEGSILFEHFWGTDTTLASLLNLPTFPDSPDQCELRTSFEGPINWRETYGTRVRGYLYPPATGNYTFWIASDDRSQLCLSTDENPAHAVQIASVAGWTPSRNFDKGPEQRSSEIPLVAGRRYYIEALHAEGWTSDNLAVAWQGPSLPTRVVISGTFLAPWIITSKATNPSPPDVAADAPTDVVLSWIPGRGAIWHHIYFGTNQADVVTGTGGTDRGTVTVPSYTARDLAYGTTYYWRVDEFDGATIHTGDVWSFTTGGPICIPTDTSVGTWDADTRTYTLTQDVSNKSIQVDQDNLTLDGAGYTLTGAGGGKGVSLVGRTGVTVKNLNVRSFYSGFYLWWWNSNGNTLMNNTANSNYIGIDIGYSYDNVLTGNIMSGNSINLSVDGYDDPDFNNDIDTTNTVDGKPVYYVRNAVGQVYDSSTNAGAFYAIHCDDITVRDLVLTKNGAGVFFLRTHNSRIENVRASDNFDGIRLWFSNNNNLILNKCDSNKDLGIRIYGNDNTLIDNRTQNNFYHGIYVTDSSHNKLINNTASGSVGQAGIWIQSSSNTTLTGNNCSNNGNGITINYSSNNTLTGNICPNNGAGISLSGSSNNTVTGNTASSNDSFGISVGWYSSSNTLTNNMVSLNPYGIYFWYQGNDNQIYNNNFISNTTQVSGYDSSGNIFNLDKPTGGNFWSDWTTPDADHDGFVDIPYVVYSGRDNLPWTRQDYWLSVDSDGVSDGVEDGAPNGGDGNGDDVLDSAQDNVTSLPNAVDSGYVTIVSPQGTSLENVTAIANPSPGDTPEGVEFPVGFFAFTISGMGEGGSATVTILLPAGQTVSTYWKYSVATDWYPFPYDAGTATGAQISDNVITLYLVDGQRGDHDPRPGFIADPGGPGLAHPPVATITGPSSGFTVCVGTPVTLSGQIDDPDPGDTHTAKWIISTQGSSEPLFVVPGVVSGDVVSGEIKLAEAGIYSIALTVTDAAGASDTAITVNDEMPAFVVVYDPEGGFVTGGGWIWSPKGAYASDPMLEGKATFGFNSKYKKGATVPTGQTEFVFQAGSLNFHATSYDWLVVAGSKSANFKGTGTINGSGSYKFKLWARDDVKDTFRIRIWGEQEAGNESVVYDNSTDQAIGGGSIVIHTN